DRSLCVRLAHDAIEGFAMMTMTRFSAVLSAALLFSSAQAGAQEYGTYRGLTLGANLQAVTAFAEPSVPQVQTLHERPALIQNVTWRRPYGSSDTTPALRDPVKQIDFSFYNDQLYRMVVQYDVERTRGMTASDL